MNSDGDVIKGQVLSKEQETYAASLRSFFDPKGAADRMDVYGKWLFASAAIVGSLGAGLSNSSFSHLRGTAVGLFACAILALGGCLIAASLSIAPHWVKARIDETTSMQEAIRQEFQHRRRELGWATAFFAFALLLAAVCPLLSLISPRNNPILHFAVDDKGLVDMGAEIAGENEGTFAELHVEAKSVESLIAPRAITTIDHDGNAKLALKISNITTLPRSSSMVLCIGPALGSACVVRKEMIVKP